MKTQANTHTPLMVWVTIMETLHVLPLLHGEGTLTQTINGQSLLPTAVTRQNTPFNIHGHGMKKINRATTTVFWSSLTNESISCVRVFGNCPG